MYLRHHIDLTVLGAAAKSRILIAEGDAKSVRVLEASLKKAGYAVTRAPSGEGVLSALEAELPDLFICDVDVGGESLLQRVRQNPLWQALPIIALYAPSRPQDRISALGLGVDECVAKPVYAKELVGRVRLLLQRRAQRAMVDAQDSNVPFSGELSDLALVDLLESLEASRKSGVVELFTEQQHGLLYFRAGLVIDAEVGPLRGEEAIYRLFTFSSGDFEVKFQSTRRRPTLQLSLDALVSEGLRRLDEWNVTVERLPPLEIVCTVRTEALSRHLDRLPDEVNPILRLCTGKRSLLQVINDSGIPDLQAARLLAKLVAEGVLGAEGARFEQLRKRPIMHESKEVARAATSASSLSMSPSSSGSGGHSNGTSHSVDLPVSAPLLPIANLQVNAQVESQAAAPAETRSVETPLFDYSALQAQVDPPVMVEQVRSSSRDVSAERTQPTVQLRNDDLFDQEVLAAHSQWRRRMMVAASVSALAVVALLVLVLYPRTDAPQVGPAALLTSPSMAKAEARQVDPEAVPVLAASAHPAAADAPASSASAPLPTSSIAGPIGLSKPLATPKTTAPKPESATETPAPAAKGAVSYEASLESGNRFYKRGQTKKAKSAFEEALLGNPEGAAALAGLARIDLDRGAAKPALAGAKRALALDPKLPDAYLIEGFAAQQLGDRSGAKAAYQHYLELQPKGEYSSEIRSVLRGL